MTDKKLKGLSRTELLELLIEQTKENDRLKAENDDLKAQLDNRLITIANAGSIAAAAIELNNVFTAADKAAAQYLDSIKNLSEAQASIREKFEKESREKSEQLIAQTKAKCEGIVSLAMQKAEKLIEESDAANSTSKKRRKGNADPRIVSDFREEVEKLYVTLEADD